MTVAIIIGGAAAFGLVAAWLAHESRRQDELREYQRRFPSHASGSESPEAFLRRFPWA